MGLSASQARLLTLTARKSDLELRSQQITNNKLLLTRQTDKAAKEYSEALNSKKLVAKGGNGYSDGVTLEDLKTAGLNGGQQVFVYNGDNQIVVNNTDYGYYEDTKDLGVEAFTNKYGYSQYTAQTIASNASGSNGVGAASNVLNNNTTDLNMTQAQYNSINAAKTALASAKSATNVSAIESKIGEMKTSLNSLPSNQKVNDAIALGDKAIALKNLTKEDLLMADMTKKGYTDDLSKVDAKNVCPSTEWSGTTYVEGEGNVPYGNSSDIKTAVSSHVNTVCTDTIASMKTAWGNINETAANTALEKTKSFFADEKVYKNDISIGDNYVGMHTNDHESHTEFLWWEWDEEHDYSVGVDNVVCHNTDAEAALKDRNGRENYDNSHINMVICAENSTDDWWMDNNAIITTFLNFYDAACAGDVNSADKNEKVYHDYGSTNSTDTSVLGSWGFGDKENGVVYSTRYESIDRSLNVSKMKAILDTINLDPIFSEKLDATTVISAKKSGFTDDNIQTQLQNAKNSLDGVAKYYKDNTYSAQVQSYIDKCANGDLTETEIKAVKGLLAQVNTYVANVANQNGTYKYNASKASYYKNLFNEMAKWGCDPIQPDADHDNDGINDEKDPNYLAKLLTGKGYVKVAKDGTVAKVDWKTELQGYEMVSDEQEIDKAKAKYERIQNKVKGEEQIYDMELSMIETEHSAVQNEEESVKSEVIDKHVEREYKIFVG